jgi:sodium transport system permease protein
MNFNIIKTIFIKELLDTIRDSKTLFVMLILPLILYPLLSIISGQIIISQTKQIKEKVILLNIEYNNNKSLIDFFKTKNKEIKLLEVDNPIKSLNEEQINLFIKTDSDFDKKIKLRKKIKIKIYYDNSNFESISAYAKIKNLIEEFSKKNLELYLNSIGIKKEEINIFDISEENIASKEKVGGFYLSSILPFLIIFMTILGAFYPSIEQIAGEKERGTLETLLTAPIKKVDIITGKFLTISLFAFVTGLLNLVSMTLSMNLLLGNNSINFNIPWISLFFILIALIPITIFFVATMMLITSLANSFKDAQNFLTPVYLIFGFPAMITIFPGFKLSLQTSLIPVANVSLLIKDLLIGKFDIQLMFLVIISTCIYSILAILGTSRLFNREDVLFSDESNFKLIFSDKNQHLNKIPTLNDAIILYIIVFALLLYLGNPIQMKYKLDGVLISELLFVLLPSLLFVKYLKFDYKKTFNIRKITLKSFIATIFLSLSSGFFILKIVNGIQEKIMPMPEEVKKSFELVLSNASLLKLFIVVVVSAGICEEFLFRGPILTGIRTKFNKIWTIIIVGLLFGIFHVNLYKIIPTSILGMITTFITLYTGSIFNGIIFHFLNNGFAIFLSGKLWLSLETPIYYFPIFSIIFLVGVYIIITENKIQEKQNKI